MYRLMTFTASRMGRCPYHLNEPIIRFGFNSNHTDSFPYIAPSCDAVEAMRDCFSDPFRRRFNRTFPEIALTAARDLAEVYFFGFLNICYKEDYPIVNCLDYVDLGLNHKRCVRYELDESKPKRYQFFDVPYFNDPKDIEGLNINKFFRAVRANYSDFFQYVEEREKYTEQLKQETSFEEYNQMEIESDKCINDTQCEFHSKYRFYYEELRVPCDCFTLIRNCMHRINSTLPNEKADDFFISKGEFGCYKQDYPIVECLEFGESKRVNLIGYKDTIKRCVRYEFNKSEPEQYQKFDVPFFYDHKDPKELNFNNILSMMYDIHPMLIAFVRMITKFDITFMFYYL